MLPLELGSGSNPLTVLCLGAHSDDLEIGCGGTLLRLIHERDVSIRWVVFGCAGQRADEAKSSADALLAGCKDHIVETHAFRDAFFRHAGSEIKEVFESLKREVSPDLVLTHARRDLHQDHRLLNQLTWNTFRDHLVLEYEIPKYDGDLGTPNLFVSLSDEMAKRKVDHLLTFFQSQRDKRWFDDETFRGLLRLRGVEAGVRYAEAFYGRKLLLTGVPEPLVTTSQLPAGK